MDWALDNIPTAKQQITGIYHTDGKKLIIPNTYCCLFMGHYYENKEFISYND